MKKVLDDDISAWPREKILDFFPVQLCPYQSQWPVLFHQMQTHLKDVLQGDILSVYHIGSTAIPEMLAKPSIDMIVEAFPENWTTLAKQLQQDGWLYRPGGDRCFPHMLFLKGYTANGIQGQCYHLRVRSPQQLDEVIFRNYLCHHAKARVAYQQLKQQLCTLTTNRILYYQGKKAFVEQILALARHERGEP